MSVLVFLMCALIFAPVVAAGSLIWDQMTPFRIVRPDPRSPSQIALDAYVNRNGFKTIGYTIPSSKPSVGPVTMRYLRRQRRA